MFVVHEVGHIEFVVHVVGHIEFVVHVIGHIWIVCSLSGWSQIDSLHSVFKAVVRLIFDVAGRVHQITRMLQDHLPWL